jgi:hypothetical protein
MTEDQKVEWFKHICEVYGRDLQGGYAVIAYPPGRGPDGVAGSVPVATVSVMAEPNQKKEMP